MAPLIELDGISFTYAGAKEPAVHDVSLRVAAGEFVILTGPSGCGKSTLCRVLNGLIPNFYQGEMEGEILLDGVSTRDKSTGELARTVGYVFQNPENQLFSLSVERDVAFGPENLGLSRKTVREKTDWAIEALGLSALRNRAPFELSSGQQQKVAIASVLAMKPKVMILDEPTSFLDPASAESVVDIVERLRREFGMTLLVVEHRLDLVSRFADRVVLMKNGELVADGPPSRVFGDEARLLGVGLPKLALLWHLLGKNGRGLGEAPLTPEQAAKKLRGLLE